MRESRGPVNCVVGALARAPNPSRPRKTMIRTRQLVLLASLTSLVCGPLAGCAASAIEDPELDTDTDDVLANEDQVEDGGEEEAEDDDPPPTPRRDASVPRDAGQLPRVDSGGQDAGSNSAKDASVDAGSKPADASAPKDAGTTPRKDAGKDTGAPPPAAGSCSKDSDCKNVCIAIGILPCCTEDKECGCTWAPGAYCL
jgi:hypothetical protein